MAVATEAGAQQCPVCGMVQIKRETQVALLPHSVLRNPVTRELITELLTRVRRDSPAGREILDMAYRAGLPV